MKYNPHDYQEYATNFVLEHPVAAIFLDCGMGKSVITLTAIYELLYNSFEVGKVAGTGGNNQPFVVEEAKCFDVRFTSEGTKNARQNCYETDTSRTIDTGGNAPDSNQGGVAVVYGICSKDSNSMKSANPDSGFYKADTARCLDANGGNPACNQGGMAVIEGNGARPSHKGDGYKEDDVMYTLNATEQYGVAYGIGRPAMNQGYNAKFSFQIEKEIEPTIVAAGPSGVAHPAFSSSKASFFTTAEEELANTLVATDYKDPPIVNDTSSYIVCMICGSKRL